MNNLRKSNKALGSQIVKYEYIENVINTQCIYVNVGVSNYIYIMVSLVFIYSTTYISKRFAWFTNIFS